MQSATIPFTGCPIDRTMPAVLQGHMSLKDWTDFCDLYDKEVKAIASRAGQSVFPTMLLVLFFGVPFIPLIFSDSQESQHNPWGVSFPDAIAIGMFLMTGGLMAILCCFGVVASRESQKGFPTLKELCEETSSKHSNLSFHFKSKPPLGASTGTSSDQVMPVYNHWIDIYITETTSNYPSFPSYNDPEIAIASTPMHGSANAYVPTVTMPSSEASCTGVGRLQELELMKYLLTEIEYAQKRSDIIASV